MVLILLLVVVQLLMRSVANAMDVATGTLDARLQLVSVSEVSKIWVLCI